MNFKKYKNKVPKKQDYRNESFEELLGVSGAADISSNNALKNSDIIYACVNLIASTIAKMSINLFEVDAEGSKHKVTNDITYLLKIRANDKYSAIDFIQTMVSNMLLYGNAYAYIETKRGVPTSLKILKNNETDLQKINDKYYVVTTIDDQRRNLDYRTVIHIKDLSSDGIKGISRIDSLKNKLKNNTLADEKIGNMYQKEGQANIKGVLNVPSELSVEAKKRLKQGFMNVLNSDDSNIAVLDGGIGFTQMNRNTSMIDNDFINSLKLNKEAIAMVYNVPLPMLGDTSNTSYSNMQELQRFFVQSLIPIVQKIEQEFNYKLLSKEDSQRMFFKFNFSSALRASDLDRAEFYKKMIEAGIYSIDDALDKEDMNRIEGGDEHYRSLNYVPLSIANNYQLSKAGATEGDNDTKEEE